MTMFFWLCYGNYGNNDFFWKLPMKFIASSLLCNNIFLVKAWRQWRQIWEGMKQWNINYSKKFKQWSDEAFNAGKEIEANEAFNASSDRFIAFLLHRFCCPALLIFSISYSKCSRVISTTSLYPFWQIETKNGLLLADSRFRAFFSSSDIQAPVLFALKVRM